LARCITLLQPEAAAGGSEPGQLSEAVAMLSNYSMLKWETEQETITAHRVVQETLRTRVPASKRETWVVLSLRLLDAARPGDPTDVRTWSRWNLLRQHVALAVVEADQVGITQPTARSMSDLGLLLYAKALQEEAEPLMRRVLAIDEQSFGQDHPNVARDLNNLALLTETGLQPEGVQVRLKDLLRECGMTP
jgi:Tetratricopeptide repeat